MHLPFVDIYTKNSVTYYFMGIFAADDSELAVQSIKCLRRVDVAIVGLNPTGRLDVCPPSICVYVVLCRYRPCNRADHPSRESYRLRVKIGSSRIMQMANRSESLMRKLGEENVCNLTLISCYGFRPNLCSLSLHGTQVLASFCPSDDICSFLVIHLSLLIYLRSLFIGTVCRALVLFSFIFLYSYLISRCQS